MHCVYSAANPIEAEVVRGLLQAHGLRATVLGEFLWGGRGELAMDAWPRVMIVDDRDLGEACALIDDYRRRPAAEAPWTCACGETSPASFAVCWSCEAQAPRP